MTTIGRIGLSLVLSAAIPAQGHAAPEAAPVILAATSQWHVDFAKDSCRALRGFGPENARTYLVLSQAWPSAVVDWMIAGEAVERLGKEARKVRVRFGPEGEALELEDLRVSVDGIGEAVRGRGTTPAPADPSATAPVTQTGLPGLDPAAGSAIEWIELSPGKGTPVRLGSGKLGSVYKVLNACTADLARSWGVDVEAHQRRASPPEPLNLQVFGQAIARHYPVGALSRGTMADLGLFVLVDEGGTPTSCRVRDETKAAGFDDKPCEILMKVARFKPALDVAGKPMASYYFTSIRYRLN